MVNRTPIEEVANFHDFTLFRHFKDAAMSAKYWAKLVMERRIIDFHYYLSTPLQQYGQMYREVGKIPDTRQGIVAYIPGGRKILCRARHYYPVVPCLLEPVMERFKRQ